MHAVTDGAVEAIRSISGTIHDLDRNRRNDGVRDG